VITGVADRCPLEMHLHVRPEQESVRWLSRDFALLDGTVGVRPVRVRVRPETRRVEADGVMCGFDGQLYGSVNLGYSLGSR
jgi:hypothetical protein